MFFDRELDNIATFWRIFRKDGVALGFTSHNRDLIFGGLRHQATPGMLPAAIRLTADLSDNSAEVTGALSHDAITDADLAAGLFDEAAIEVGAVDWESVEHRTLYSGRLGRISTDGLSFSAELRSAKQELQRDLVPRTSPTCRASFCGPGCSLSAFRFTSRHHVHAVDIDLARIQIANIAGGDFVDGQLRFLEGPQTGLTFGIVSVENNWLSLDRAIAAGVAPNMVIELREGCDHTLRTCTERFGNARNFRGEPFLPGNDLLARYGQS